MTQRARIKLWNCVYAFPTVLGVTVLGFILVVAMAATPARVRSEAPPVTDPCQWMYDKALNLVLTLDAVGNNTTHPLNWVEGHYAGTERFIMWAQLYSICKLKNGGSK